MVVAPLPFAPWQEAQCWLQLAFASAPNAMLAQSDMDAINKAVLLNVLICQVSLVNAVSSFWNENGHWGKPKDCAILPTPEPAARELVVRCFDGQPRGDELVSSAFRARPSGDNAKTAPALE